MGTSQCLSGADWCNISQRLSGAGIGISQRVRQSPVHWYVSECEVLVRHRQPGRGGPCQFPNFQSPQELRGLGRIGGATTLMCYI